MFKALLRTQFASIWAALFRNSTGAKKKSAGKAVLVCAEPEYLDLALGIDLSVGYAELVDFNHHFRIMETAALRIKDPASIVVFS